MATQAYVFVYVAAGKTGAVAKAISRLAGVKSAHACWGRPDVIAFVEAPNPRCSASSCYGRSSGYGALRPRTHESLSRIEGSAEREEAECGTL